MAIGSSNVSKVRNFLENIEKAIKYGDSQTETQALYSCWNTFQYVSKNLGEWANDTTIGAETREDLIKLSNVLGSLIEETRMLQSKLLTFCDEQDSINEQNTNWKNGQPYVTANGREIMYDSRW